MTDPITLTFAGAYAVSMVALLVWVRRFPVYLRRYCYPLLGLVVLATVTQTLSGLAVGVFTVSGGELDIPNLIDGAIAYGTLFGFAAYLADVSRRKLALAVGLPVSMNVAFQGAAIGSGVVALVGALVVVLGYPVLGWLYFRPFVQTVKQRSANRQRLYRKFRNLLLFLIGVLIVTAFTTLSVFDPDISSILVSYIDFLLRVGFAGFLFANVGVFREFE
jgi:sensory rhodopsin